MRSALPLAPYRPFFLAATLDALLGVGVWPLASLGWIPSTWVGVLLAVWHRQELLAGMVPAVLAGFLLTALPRWVNGPPVSALTVRRLLALWLTGRVLHLLVPAAAGPLAALFVALLAWEIGRRIAAAGNRRNYKVVGLLVLLALGTALAGDHPLASPDAYGARLSVVGILGLVLVLGGRIIPALTAAYIGEQIRATSRRKGVETAAALVTGFSLGAWILAPSSPATAIACALAALVQAARLSRWKGWRVAGTPALIFLHLGYGWLVVGFALMALAPPPDGQAALHAWTMGGIGLTCLCVMASMIRRHTGTAFTPSPLFTAAAVCASLAVPARLMFAGRGWLLPALLWMAANVLFLAAFGRVLCGVAPRPIPAPDQRTG